MSDLTGWWPGCVGTPCPGALTAYSRISEGILIFGGQISDAQKDKAILLFHFASHRK